MFEPCVPIAIPTNVRLVVVDDPLCLDDAVDRAIDAEWNREQTERAVTLINNPILSYLGFDGQTIYGRFIEYRHYIASLLRPDLLTRGSVAAMGISGLTLVEDGLAFARRSSRVTSYPNLWELVPSGSIDRESLFADGTIDFRATLATELLQEVHIAIADRSAMRPYALIYDPNIRTYDIALVLDTGLTKKDFMEKARTRSEDEYSHVECVAFDDLDAFVERKRREIIPVSMTMLETRWLDLAFGALHG